MSGNWWRLRGGGHGGPPQWPKPRRLPVTRPSVPTGSHQKADMSLGSFDQPGDRAREGVARHEDRRWVARIVLHAGRCPSRRRVSRPGRGRSVRRGVAESAVDAGASGGGVAGASGQCPQVYVSMRVSVDWDGEGLNLARARECGGAVAAHRGPSPRRGAPASCIPGAACRIFVPEGEVARRGQEEESSRRAAEEPPEADPVQRPDSRLPPRRGRDCRGADERSHPARASEPSRHRTIIEDTVAAGSADAAGGCPTPRGDVASTPRRASRAESSGSTG